MVPVNCGNNVIFHTCNEHLREGALAQGRLGQDASDRRRRWPAPRGQPGADSRPCALQPPQVTGPCPSPPPPVPAALGGCQRPCEPLTAEFGFPRQWCWAGSAVRGWPGAWGAPAGCSAATTLLLENARSFCGPEIGLHAPPTSVPVTRGHCHARGLAGKCQTRLQTRPAPSRTVQAAGRPRRGAVRAAGAAVTSVTIRGGAPRGASPAPRVSPRHTPRLSASGFSSRAESTQPRQTAPVC